MFWIIVTLLMGGAVLIFPLIALSAYFSVNNLTKRLKRAEESVYDLESRLRVQEAYARRQAEGEKPGIVSTAPATSASRLSDARTESESPSETVLISPPDEVIAPQEDDLHLESPVPLDAMPEETVEPATNRPVELDGVMTGSESSAQRHKEPREPLPVPSFIDWEQFTGVKLFSWIGGLALFLAVIFFVKYSYERGFISPQLRIAGGLLLGMGCIGGGLMMDRIRYSITIHALTASGIAILYGSLYSGHALHGLLGNAPTFALMTLVTAAAFFLAVRLDARYVAAMGLLGGFLTPPLLSTGVDRPFGLFSYITLLDAGLIAVALRKRWSSFVLLSAIGTIIIQWGWFNKFFSDPKSLTGTVIFLFFPIAYAAVVRPLRRRDLAETAEYSALITNLSALAFGWAIITGFYSIAATGTLVLAVTIFASAIPISIQDGTRRVARMHQAVMIIAFLMIIQWIELHLADELLHKTLAALLTFGGLHSIAGVRAARDADSEDDSNARVSESDIPRIWPVAIPVVVLLALFMPLSRDLFTPLFWPTVLAVNLLGLVVAHLLGFMAVSQLLAVVTMVMIGFWIGRLPPHGGLWGMIVIIVLFSALFIAAALWTLRKSGSTARDLIHPVLMPAAMPYILLIAADVQLQPSNPSPLFVVAILLYAVLLSLVTHHRVDIAAPIAIAGCWCLSFYHQSHYVVPGERLLMLAWNTAFPLLFLASALVFRWKLGSRVTPWLSHALAGPFFFYLAYQFAKQEFGMRWIGVMPALWSLPYIAALAFLARDMRPDHDEQAQLDRRFLLALMSGVGLFFITLIFPIQFEKQWITISWAFEAFALLSIHRRIPHRGLVLWATGLLAVCFVRLAMNPGVFHYVRGPQQFLLNWFAYTYLLCAAAFFFSARRMYRIDDPAWTPRAGGFVTSGAVVLLFYLMNIEIGHAFRADSSGVLGFSGRLARDMTYSLGWACFAACLLVIGIAKKLRPCRLAGLVLLSVACIKVFLHDLWQLGQLYRVGSFAGLAIIMMLVSYLYQRFVPPDSDEKGDA